MFGHPLGWFLLLPCLAVAADKPAYVQFEAANLVQGRAVWLDTCESCHGYGIAGAPIPMEADEWRARLEQHKTQLYEHAIQGFFGPDDTYMPPRGGNDNLTDSQVKLAVDYMAALATYYIQNTEKSQ